MKLGLNIRTLFELAAISLIACSPVKFAANGAGGSDPLKGPTLLGTCDLQKLTIPIKVMFVVDTSGSNVRSTMYQGTTTCDPSAGQPCSPATDPQKTLRGGSIETFFNLYKSKSNFSWGFEVFAANDSHSYIVSNGQEASFGNAPLMQAAISAFYSKDDNDATPYLAALADVQTAIAGDSDLHSTAARPPLYKIIFISDGYPTDALKSDGSVDLTTINSVISNIVAMAPNRITLSSVYYGTLNDPAAAVTLQSMAGTGHGQFVNVDTGSTDSIKIDDLVQVPTDQCW